MRDDNHGRKPECPVVKASDDDCDLSRWRAGDNGALFSPQGGLRISANGLARIGQLLLGDGSVDDVRLLQPASIEMLVQPLWTYAPETGMTFEEDSGLYRGFFCRYGLAVQTLRRSATVAATIRSATAWRASAIRVRPMACFQVDREAGTGVVYFATGMPGERSGGRSAFSAVEEALARGR